MESIKTVSCNVLRKTIVRKVKSSHLQKMQFVALNCKCVSEIRDRKGRFIMTEIIHCMSFMECVNREHREPFCWKSCMPLQLIWFYPMHFYLIFIQKCNIMQKECFCKFLNSLYFYHTELIKFSGPVPEAANQAQAMSLPITCFTDKLVCSGSGADIFFLILSIMLVDDLPSRLFCALTVSL